MRAPIHTLAAIGVLAVAAPASALTVQQAAASPASARFSDPDAALEGAGSNLCAAIAGGGSQDAGHPTYGEEQTTGSDDLGALYAADPVRFMARINGAGSANPAAPVPTVAVQADASKAPPETQLGGR